MADDKDQIVEHGHDYDGIKEYDNPPPPWLMWIFYISILFSGCYLAYYTGESLALGTWAGSEKATAWERARFRLAEAEAAAEKKPELSQDAYKQLALAGGDYLKKGQALYLQNCVSCHAAEGQGLIGPNLTDNAWVHGGSTEEIAKIIRDGYLPKGMIAWGKIVGEEGVWQITSYMESIRGKNIAGPRPAEGTEYKAAK